MDATDQEMMPTSYKILQKYQNKEKSVQNKVNTSMLKAKSFCGTGSRNIELATNNGKMYILKPLHKNIIDWYHTYLMNSGVTRTEETIKQHLYWPGIQI